MLPAAPTSCCLQPVPSRARPTAARPPTPLRLRRHVPIVYTSEVSWQQELWRLLPTLLLIGGYVWFTRRQLGGLGGGGGPGGRGIFNVGKASVVQLDKNAKNKVTFADVAGCDEAKVRGPSGAGAGVGGRGAGGVPRAPMARRRWRGAEGLQAAAAARRGCGLHRSLPGFAARASSTPTSAARSRFMELVDFLNNRLLTIRPPPADAARSRSWSLSTS